jgi:glycosyltransferase involved in cell wall biosynthesis
VVHFASTLRPPFSFAFFLPVALRGAASIVTVHDPLPHGWLLPQSLRWLERPIFQLPYRLANRLIVHNETGKEVLMRQVGRDPDSISVIPHGPYPEAAEGRQPYPRFDCLRLLAFGSIRADKGLHLAIRAVQASSSGSSVPLRLTIAGALHTAAEEPYWQTCKRLIAEKPDGIEVIERRIPDEEVAPLLARHHAMILPYTDFFSESGVANLALSHRRPIIATAFGGLRELIEKGNCGIPIADPSVEALSQALITATNLGPERLEAMGCAGNHYIRMTRSWNLVARQTIELYSNTAGKLVATHPAPAKSSQAAV